MDANATLSWGAYLAEKISNPWNTATASAGLAASAGYWFYQKTITDPLRTFYFVGPYWHNAPIPEVCFRMTNVDSKFWSSSADHMQECNDLTERQFRSFDATVMTTLYFTVLTFGLLQLCCQCCLVRPIIRALRR
jgi:hypothetical protein